MTDTSRGVLEHRGGRHVLRYERVLAHPREKVWRALTDNAELARWFPVTMHGARAPGAKLRFDFASAGAPMDAELTAAIEQAQRALDEDDPNLHGEMLTVDPPHLLEYLWAKEHLRWELHEEGAGTRLVFLHTFDDLGMGARVAAGWDVSLDGLRDQLDGAPPAILTSAAFDALFEEYAASFPPEASTTPRPGST